MATAPLTISVAKDALPRQYTLLILANSTLGSYEASINATFPATKEGNTYSQSTTTVDVLEPLTLLDRLGLGYSGIPINIPKEYLIGFYGIVLSFLIPGIARWFNTRRQTIYVSKYMTDITSTYDSFHQNKDECEHHLENIRRHVAETFAKGKINESNYKILNEKIDEYKNKVNNK